MSEMPFGNSPKKLFQMELNYAITDFCYTKIGFLFLLRNEHCIGKVDFKGNVELPFLGLIGERGQEFEYDSRLSFPSSICYNKQQDTAFVVENGGDVIRKIEFNPLYTITLITNKDSIDLYFKNADAALTHTCCDIDSNNVIYWGVKNLHRIFKMDGIDICLFAGNGKPTFSMATDPRQSSFSRPSGIKVFNNNVYITEQGNHCIRQINSGKVNLTAGMPHACGDNDGKGIECNFSHLRKLVGFKNLLYFIDNNKIKYFSLIQKNIGTIYAPKNNIVSIDSDKENTIYILERQK